MELRRTRPEEGLAILSHIITRCDTFEWWDLMGLHHSRTVCLFPKRLSATRFDWGQSISYDSLVSRVRGAVGLPAKDYSGHSLCARRRHRPLRRTGPLLHYSAHGPLGQRCRFSVLSPRRRCSPCRLHTFSVCSQPY